jgi:hypothetical protein
MDRTWATRIATLAVAAGVMVGAAAARIEAATPRWEQCLRVYNGPFFGHYPTCWKKWPHGWPVCPSCNCDAVPAGEEVLAPTPVDQVPGTEVPELPPEEQFPPLEEEWPTEPLDQPPAPETMPSVDPVAEPEAEATPPAEPMEPLAPADEATTEKPADETPADEQPPEEEKPEGDLVPLVPQSFDLPADPVPLVEPDVEPDSKAPEKPQAKRPNRDWTSRQSRSAENDRQFRSSSTAPEQRMVPASPRRPRSREAVLNEPPRHLRQRQFSSTSLDENPLRSKSAVQQASATMSEATAPIVEHQDSVDSRAVDEAAGRPFAHSVQRIPSREEPSSYPRRALFQSRIDLLEAANQGVSHPQRMAEPAQASFQAVPLTPQAAEPILPVESSPDDTSAGGVESNPLRKSAPRPQTSLSHRIQNPLRTRP